MEKNKSKPPSEYDSENGKSIDTIKVESALAGFGIAVVCNAALYSIFILFLDLSGTIGWVVDWLIIFTCIYLVRLILKFYNNI